MGTSVGPAPAERPRRRARGRWWVWGLGSLVAVGSVAWIVEQRWGNSTTPLGIDEVAAGFGDRPDTSVLPSTSSAVAGPTSTSTGTGISGVPAVSSSTLAPVQVLPGVYRYASSGREGIDVLDRPTHEYPAESAVVVSPTECGIRVEWLPLEERREWFEVCLTDGGLRLVQYGGFHRFFGQHDERSMVCGAEAWLLAPGMQPGGSSTAMCSGSGNIDQRTTTFVRRDEVVLDGAVVPVSVVLVEVEGSGATSSVSTRELWLTDGGLPVVWIDQVAGRSDSVVGPVNYTEYAELRAVSLVPV